MTFPAEMLVDYVRVYQRDGEVNVGCSPPDYPTEDYINNHPNAYNNPNLTSWTDAGYTKPKNSLVRCYRLQYVPLTYFFYVPVFSTMAADSLLLSICTVFSHRPAS